MAKLENTIGANGFLVEGASAGSLPWEQRGGVSGVQDPSNSTSEPGEVHPRAARIAEWARTKSSEVQLTGAHVPLTPEEIAAIEGRTESDHKPVLLERQESDQMVSPTRDTPIERYAFLDEKKKVKVYIEIEGIGEIESKVSCDFQKDTFNLYIHDDESSGRRLFVDDLHCPIDPEKSKFTVKANKIIVSLHKEIESTWYRLRKGA